MAKIQSSGMEKLIQVLAKSKEKLKKELDEVQKKYPLVYQAYYLQLGALIEIHVQFSDNERLVGVLTGGEGLGKTAERIGVRMRECGRKRDTELGRARSSEDIKNAASNYVNCIRNAANAARIPQ